MNQDALKRAVSILECFDDLFENKPKSQDEESRLAAEMLGEIVINEAGQEEVRIPMSKFKRRIVLLVFKERRRKKLEPRNDCIALTIQKICDEFNISATRNEATDPSSACDIVAEAYNELARKRGATHQNLTYENVRKRIWDPDKKFRERLGLN